MADSMTCFCGHQDFEHRSGKCGWHECEVEDCDCLCFEHDEASDEQEDSRNA